MEKVNKVIDETAKSPSMEEGTKSEWKHMLLMMLCCLAPVGMSLALTQMGYNGVGNYLLFLLCPIIHLLMMRNMDKKDRK